MLRGRLLCALQAAAPVAGARRMCVARDGTAKPSGEIKRAIWDLKLSSELWGHSVGLAGSELESESDSGSDNFFLYRNVGTDERLFSFSHSVF